MSELDTTETGVMHPFIVLATSNDPQNDFRPPVTVVVASKTKRIWFANDATKGDRFLVADPVPHYVYRYDFMLSTRRRRNVFAVQKLVACPSLSAWVYIFHIEMNNPLMVKSVLPALKTQGLILDFWRNIRQINQSSEANAVAVKAIWPSSPGWRVDISATDVPDYSGAPRIGLRFADECAVDKDYDKGEIDE